MNTKTNADVPAPLYGRISDYSGWAYCCDERMALCPECGAPLCVFCMEDCDSCQTSIW